MKNILKLNNLNYRFINRDPNMQIKELHYHSIKRFSEFLGLILDVFAFLLIFQK